MSKKDKLVTRFTSIPSDFTWKELIIFLNYYNYQEVTTGKTSGSGRRFADSSGNLILLHKPHPSSIVKKYVFHQVLENLKEKGEIKDE